MFGQDNDEDQNNNQGYVDAVLTPTAPATDDALGLSDESTNSGTASPPTAPTNNGFVMDTVAPTPPAPTPVTVVAPTPTTPIGGAVSNDLLNIKQEALQHLSPLLGHLEQSPEEKFRTAMMMIQASDDHGLIKEAYETAKQIPDEKVRAQALLDIVNEINYFTQQHSVAASHPTPQAN